jgi:hypothetical protein
MDVSFVLWSFKEVLAKIPFDSPAEGSVDLNFSEIAAPHYVKHNFKVSIEYEAELPYDASYAVYSPENKYCITVPIIMRRENEEYLRRWNNGDKSPEVLSVCCMRKELYCHEACHLIAIIRAFPSERTSLAHDDFLKKINDKFDDSFEKATDARAVPLATELSGSSPSTFDKYHFPYGNDSLNYFKLYEELMFPYDKMVEISAPLAEKFKQGSRITLDDIAKEAFVPKTFFDTFPDKLTTFQQMLAEKLFKK